MAGIWAWIQQNPELLAAIVAIIYAITPPGSPLHKILEMLKVVKPAPVPGPGPAPVDPLVPGPTPNDRPIIDAVIRWLPTIVPMLVPMLMAEQARLQAEESKSDVIEQIKAAKKGRS